MKKISICILAFLLTLTMTSCSKGQNFKNQEALVDFGIEVAKTMQEMVYSDEYISLYTSNIYEDEITKFRATDYDSPIAIYSIEIPDAKVLLSKIDSGFIDKYNNLSYNLKEQMDNKVSFSSIISVLNAKSGTNTMALCSLLIATKHNEDIKLDKRIAYLYVFEKGVPIVVTFTEYGYANGSFLMLNESKSYEEIKETFIEFSCKVEKIK